MNGLRKINMSIDYRNEIETKDVSKINLANEAVAGRPNLTERRVHNWVCSTYFRN